MYYRQCLQLITFLPYERFCAIIDSLFRHNLNFLHAGNELRLCPYSLMTEFLLYATIVLNNLSKLTTDDPFEAQRTLQALYHFNNNIQYEKIEEAVARHYEELQQIEVDLLAARGCKNPVPRRHPEQYFPHMSETGTWTAPEVAKLTRAQETAAKKALAALEKNT